MKNLKRLQKYYNKITEIEKTIYKTFFVLNRMKLNICMYRWQCGKLQKMKRKQVCVQGYD